MLTGFQPVMIRRLLDIHHCTVSVIIIIFVLKRVSTNLFVQYDVCMKYLNAVKNE